MTKIVFPEKSEGNLILHTDVNSIKQAVNDNADAGDKSISDLSTLDSTILKYTLTPYKYIDGSDGVIYDNTNFQLTSPIDLGGSKYLTYKGDLWGNAGIVFLDINSLRVGGYNPTLTHEYEVDFEVPENCVTIRCSVNNTRPFSISKNLSKEVKLLRPLAVSIGSEIISPITWENGKFITKNGEIASHETLSLSSLIPVNQGIYKHIGALSLSGEIAFFDFYQKTVGGFANPDQLGTTNICDVEIPVGVKFIRASCLTVNLPSFSFTTDLTKRLKSVQYNSGFINTTDKTIYPSGADFSSISEGIAYANANASPTHAINLLIKNGTFNECNLLISTDNVNLIGENRELTIINADGTGGDMMSQQGLMARTTGHHKNLTIKTTGTRYCLHNDGMAGAFDCIFENCHFIYYNPTVEAIPVGIGAYANQHHKFIDCIFEIQGVVTSAMFGEWGIFWHNWQTQTANATLELINPTFINCGQAYIFDNGSSQSDSVKIINPKSNLIHKGIKLDATSIDIPYDIDIKIFGDVANVEATPARITSNYHFEGNYDTLAHNFSGAILKKGYGVSLLPAYFNLNSKEIGGFTGKLYGIVEKDSAINDNVYVITKGHCGMAYSIAGNYLQGDLLKCNVGVFQKTIVESESVAVVMTSSTIAVDGLIQVLITF